jgi:hypothetical protein
MKKTFTLASIMFLNFFLSPAKACEVTIANTEIINSEFYIDFTTVVENILQKHGYKVVQKNAKYQFEAKNYITTGTNYFRLKQANIDFIFEGINTNIKIHELKNCLTVSCTGSDYLKALKSALKKFDKQLTHCSLL